MAILLERWNKAPVSLPSKSFIPTQGIIDQQSPRTFDYINSFEVLIMFLTFKHKREIFRSFPELIEEVMSNGRVNYRYEASKWPRKVVATELSQTGNGYVYGGYLVEYKKWIDDRGWINIRDFSEKPLRELIRKAIISFGGEGVEKSSNETNTTEYKTNWPRAYTINSDELIRRPDHANKELRVIQRPIIKPEATPFKEPLRDFLTQHGFLPIDKGAWNRFEIIHKKPESVMERNEINDYIAGKVKEANGLYVYTKPDGEVLYIGKAKPLKGRLQSHYRESFEEVPGDTKDKRWHRFFLTHQGKLLVYWREVEDEGARAIIEKMLTYVSPPLFESWR